MHSKVIKKLSVVPLLISFHFSFVIAHWDAAYFSNRKDGFKIYNDWMKKIPDDALLSELALPGTHDSCTFTAWTDIVRTQSITFSEQLEFGIRFFDIRIRHTSNKFALHHDRVFMGLMFGDFLSNVTHFLHENPSETVLFRLKEDHKPDTTNTRSMGQTLEEYLDRYGSTYLRTTSTGIKLGDARGKYIIISDNYEFHYFGIPYSNFQKQDVYSVRTIWDLYKKWEAVREHLDNARNGYKSQFFINYLSASGGALPYFIASGHITSGTSSLRLFTGLITPKFKSYYPDFPRIGCGLGICSIVFEGTNTLTRDYLRDHPLRKRSAGVIMADFPGTDLISTIINENF